MPQPLSAIPALLCVLALAALGTAPAVASPACPGQSLIPRRSDIAQIAQAALCLINRERRIHGLRGLRENLRLDHSARAHSQSMVLHAYFSHDSLGGASPFARIRQSGYRHACVMGENIAAGQGRLGTAAAIVRAWMSSPGHRANILGSRYRDTGIGVAYGYPGSRRRGATFTQDFGAHC